MSFEAIVRGTPVWVWILLVFLLSRGIKALKGGTAPLGKLAIVPVVFAVWGIAHLATEQVAGWQSAAAWVLGAVAGLLVGVFIARTTSFTVDRVQKREILFHFAAVEAARRPYRTAWDPVPGGPVNA